MRSVMAENQLSEVLMERDQDLIPFHCGLYNASNRRKLSAISATNAVFFLSEEVQADPQTPFQFYHGHYDLHYDGHPFNNLLYANK